MEYRILGPLDVISTGSGPVKIEGAKTRALLVLLLLSRNTVVSTERIAEDLWAGTPPPSAAGTIHAYVSRLRRALTDAGQPPPLVTRKPGYLLRVAPGELDADGFEDLLKQAPGEAPRQAVILLDRALALWRGPALAEFADLTPALREADRLDELRLVAVERRIEAELANHRHGELVPELERLAAENPFRESLTGLLMTALYRAGRQSDALLAYQAAYQRLTREVGVVPGPALRALESAILRHDPSIAAPPVAAAPTAPLPVGPAPLPAGPVRLRHGSALVDRDAERAALHRAWSRLGTAGCRLVAVTGEAGIGKSRLVAELAYELHGRGATVLWGRALDRQVLPYQPFVEALGDHLAARGPDGSAALATTVGRPLTWLLPGLPNGTPTAHEPAEPGARRYLMFEATTALLAELTGAHGLLLVVEDAHLTDASTLSMVEHVVRRAQRGPMAVLATLDDALADAHEPLRDVLAGLDRDDLLTRVAVSGLPENAVGALMASVAGAAGGVADVAPASVRAMHARTGGNPLFIEELVRDGGGVGELPARVRDLVAMRLARLDPDLTDVLRTAALVGAEFETEIVAEVLDRPAASIDAVLDRAVRARLIDSVTVAPRRLRFGHQLVYDAVVASLAGDRTDALRRRLVDALTGRDDYYAVLARHFRMSADEDARRSVEYSRRAGDHALEHLGFAEAARHYREALDTLAGLPGDLRRERCELLLLLGTARRALYQRLATQDAYLRAAEIAIALRVPRLLVRAAWGLLTISEFSASTPATVALFEHGLADLAEEDSLPRVALIAGLARALPHGPRAVWLARYAIAMARRLGDPEGVLCALGGGLLTIWAPDNLDERVAYGSEVIATGHELGWAELATEARAWRSACAEELGDQAAADADLDAVRAWANATRQPFFLGLLDLRGAARALLQGRYDEAERLATAAVRGIDAGPDFHAGYAAQLFALRRDQGRLAEVDPMLTELLASAPRIPAWRAARAVADVELGRVEAARAIVDALAEDDFAALPRDWLWLSAIGHVADCCTDLTLRGMPAPTAVATLYRLLTPYKDRCIVLAHGVLCQGAVARQLGALAAAMGRYDQAVAHFEAALAINHAQGARPWLARTQLGYADALLRRGAAGDAEAASALRAEADATIAAIGAAGLAWRSRLLREHSPVA